jgi:N-acetylglucosamine-6-sulfatase
MTRTSLLLAFAVAAAALAAGRDGSAAQAPQPRPNIVVVMSDDQTAESMRVMTQVNTLLGRAGATFSNSFASFPLCCPSRATFLSGQYGHNHTVMGNRPPQGGYEKWRTSESNSLPVWLRAAGYHTVHIGKYLNGYGREAPTHVPAGWSEWLGSIDPSTYRFYDYTLNENGRLTRYGSAPQEYQADVYTAKAVDAVRRLAPRAQPFFLSVAYLAPHSGGPREPGDPRNLATPVPAPRHKGRFASEPLPTPPSFNEADVSDKPRTIATRPLLPPQRVRAIESNYRQRLESLLAVDEGVAQIVNALAAAGELANTLFVYTSDNGFFHGEHRVALGKVQAYEPSARVPLVMRGPGIGRGVVVAEPAINVDLAATIVDAANAKAGRTLDGVSLLTLFRDRGRMVGRDVLLETPAYSAIRTPRYVYVEHATGERELYDLARDPHQLASRAGDPALARVRSDLAQRLLRLRMCRGDGCRRGPDVRLAVRCSGRAHRATVGGPEARLVTRVDWSYRGRRAGSDRRAPFTATLPRAAGVVRATLTLGDGRRATRDQRARACR